jgi:hypothetical protein
MVCDANCVACFPILSEASLFLNMSRRGKDVGTLILKLKIMPKLPNCHYHCVGDEDITPTDTNNTPQDDIQGPITRARARQLNLQVSSFLSNVYCESENRLLPNNLIVLRNKGEDQQGCGEGLGGVEDQQGRPDQDGGPNRFDFVSVSDSRNRPH